MRCRELARFGSGSVFKLSPVQFRSDPVLSADLPFTAGPASESR